MRILKRCLLTLSLALLIAPMIGCDDKDAQELAGQLATITKSYQEQLVRSAKGEQTAYRKLSAAYVQADRRDVVQALMQEQIERAGRFADDVTYVKEAQPLLSDIQRELRDYAELDFTDMQSLMKDESEASAAYLAQLQKISVDTKKIEALTKSFENLSKRKPNSEQVKEMSAFWQQTKKEIDKQYCRDLTGDSAALEGKIAAQTDAPAGETPLDAAIRRSNLEAMKSELEILKGQKDAKKCDALLAEK